LNSASDADLLSAWVMPRKEESLKTKVKSQLLSAIIFKAEIESKL
jgi:hypothetical protein